MNINHEYTFRDSWQAAEWKSFLTSWLVTSVQIPCMNSNLFLALNWFGFEIPYIRRSLRPTKLIRAQSRTHWFDGIFLGYKVATLTCLGRSMFHFQAKGPWFRSIWRGSNDVGDELTKFLSSSEEWRRFLRMCESDFWWGRVFSLDPPATSSIWRIFLAIWWPPFSFLTNFFLYLVGLLIFDGDGLFRDPPRCRRFDVIFLAIPWLPPLV